MRSMSRDFDVSGPPLPEVLPEEISVPQQVVPEGVRRIGASAAWSRGHRGQGVYVAVLDTGIDRGHPDLVDNVAAVFDCWPLLSAVDLEPPPAQPPEPARDLHGHGTHVAGTIAAVDNPTNPFGVVGVAPQARIHAVKVLNDINRGTVSPLICGLEYVRERAPTSGATNPIRVANLSIWGDGRDLGNCGAGSDELHAVICEVVGAGVSVVSIAGNAGTRGHALANVANYVPGAYDEVITATALADSDGLPCGLGATTGLGGDDTFAVFSNFAEAVDQPHLIAAPGVRILSTVRRVQGLTDPNGSYAYMDGTSMAAPHVSGAAALFIARELAAGRPAPSPAAVLSFLRDNGEPLGVNFQGECTRGGVSHSDPRGWGNSEPVVRVDGI